MSRHTRSAASAAPTPSSFAAKVLVFFEENPDETLSADQLAADASAPASAPATADLFA